MHPRAIERLGSAAWAMANPRGIAVTIAIVAQLSVLSASEVSNGTARVVAFSGGHAIGFPPEFQNLRFDAPVINATGVIAFAGRTNQPPGTSYQAEAVWRVNGSIIVPIVKSGDSVPGVDNSQFLAMSRPNINAEGNVVFRSTIAAQSNINATSTGVWVSRGVGVEKVAHESDPPVAGNFIGLSAVEPAINDGGEVRFHRFEGIYGKSPGEALTTTVHEGDSAPGTAQYFQTFFSDDIINTAGDTAFSASLTGLGTNGDNDSGIWASTGGGMLRLLAREGDHPPGTPNEEVFGDFLVPVINQHGQIAFSASVEGPGVGGLNNLGIWVERSPDDLQMLIRLGDAVPGIPEATFGFNGFDPIINAANQVAFSSRLHGNGFNSQNDDTIWRVDPDGQFHLIVRQGDPAPGAGVDVKVGDLVTGPILNADGSTAFVTKLMDTGANDTALWIADGTGGLTLVAKTGDLLDVGGISRQITTVEITNVTGNDSGRPSSFSDSGALAFRAFFADGTQAILAVPEPSTLALACIGALVLLARAGRR